MPSDESGAPCDCPPDACLCGFAETFNASQNRLRAERDRYREALRPFSALADALEGFDGMTDAEWCRVKERVRGHAMAARAALDA